MKQLLCLFLTIICFCLSSVLGQTQKNEWHNVTYLEPINFKMRVTTFDKPIVLEWGTLPVDISSTEVKEKLKCLSVSTYFSVLDLDYATWKKYCTEEIDKKSLFRRHGHPPAGTGLKYRFHGGNVAESGR